MGGMGVFLYHRCRIKRYDTNREAQKIRWDKDKNGRLMDIFGRKRL